MKIRHLLLEKGGVRITRNSMVLPVLQQSVPEKAVECIHCTDDVGVTKNCQKFP